MPMMPREALESMLQSAQEEIARLRAEVEFLSAGLDAEAEADLLAELHDLAEGAGVEPGRVFIHSLDFH